MKESARGNSFSVVKTNEKTSRRNTSAVTDARRRARERRRLSNARRRDFVDMSATLASADPSVERRDFVEWLTKMRQRAPILPPPYVPFDDASERSRESIARETLRACGAALRVLERWSDGDETTPGENDEVLYRATATTSSGIALDDRDGDSDVPRRAVLQDEHCDVTRGLEIALMNMGAGARWRVRCDWSVTYGHETAKTRGLRPDPRLREGDAVVYDVEVVNRMPVVAVRVRERGDGSDVALATGGRARATKKITVSGSGWETPRPPFEATIEASAMLVRHRSTERGVDAEEFMEKKTVTFEVGDGRVPLALDAAVRTMRLHEEALVWSNYGGFGTKAKGSSMRLIPALPSDDSDAPDGVAYKVRLAAMRQVRDVFDDGTTKKTRTREGQGHFPSDCPMNDCMVRVHFVLSTATAVGTRRTLAPRYDTRADPKLKGKPFEFRLGCGALPEALETSIRLMIPREESRVVLDLTLGEKARQRGYDAKTCQSDAPGREHGASESLATVQWDVVLESFDAAVNWYKADLSDMLEEALVIKEEANALFKTEVYELARAKYEKTLHKLESLRGLDEADFERVNAMKHTLALNLVASLQKLHRHVDAMKRVNKILDADPTDAKALFRRSVSFLALHEFTAARDDLFACLDANPSLQSTVAKQLDVVKRHERQALASERANFNFKGKLM